MCFKIVKELFLAELVIDEAVFDGDEMVGVELWRYDCGIEVCIFFTIGG